MTDNAVTWYQIDRHKVVCRICKQPARCNLTRWTPDEGEIAFVACDGCGHAEWRPVKRDEKK